MEIAIQIPRAAAAVKNQNRNRRLKAELIAYVTRNPNASDSVAGVAAWWLGPSGDDASLDDVQVALDQLVTAGLLTVVKAPGGGNLYAKKEHK